MLKRFISKKLIFTVFLSLSLTFNMQIYGAKSISQLQNEQRDLKIQSNKTQSSLDGTKREKSEALTEVERLDNELTEVQKEINSLNKKLEETKETLTKTQEDLKKANADKESQIDIFRERMRIIYENGTEGYFEIILESEDFSDFLRRTEYADKIIEYDQNVIAQYEATEKRIARDIENIKVKKEEIEKLSKEEEEKKAVLDKRIEEKQELVKKLSEDEKLYLQQLQDLKDADEEIAVLIRKEQARLEAKKKAAAEKRAAEAAARANAAKNNSSSSNNNTNSNINNNTNNTNNNPKSAKPSNPAASSSGGKMLYPVPAYSGAEPNESYGKRTNPISGKEEVHTGLDLKATMNTDVVAAASGTVIFAGTKGGYGNTVIVDHGDGTSTLYGHNSSLTVNVGDEVSRGQVIAKAGTTGYSTGVHVHFEVRKNGMAVDPTPYLK